MKWGNGFLIGSILLSVLVMCHSGDDDDDDENGHHHDKQYRSAGVSDASSILPPMTGGSRVHRRSGGHHEEATIPDDIRGAFRGNPYHVHGAEGVMIHEDGRGDVSGNGPDQLWSRSGPHQARQGQPCKFR